MFSFRSLLLVFLLFSLTGLEEVLGQCGPCNVTLTANNNPAIGNGDIVCLIVNRSSQINLRDANNITVCIATGVTYSNTFDNLNGNNVTINNYGQIGTSGSPINLTLGKSGSFNNFADYFGNFTSNGASDLNNSGSIIGNILLNSTGAIFTNSGSQTGELILNNNSLINSGSLNLSLLSIGGSSPGITNTLSGSIILNQNSNFSLNATLVNAGTFKFTRDNRNFSIASGVTLTNTGSLSVNRNFTNNGNFNGSTGSLVVGRDLDNNSNSTLNLGNTIVDRNFTNNNLTTLAGSLEIGNNLTNNGSSIIRPLNTNQCNTIFVDDNFVNNNTNGITGNNLSGQYRAPLIVNKIPGNRDVTDGAVVDPSLDCSCGVSFTSSGSFIVPAGVNTITMKTWGGGGKGGNRVSNAGRSGGGGAGAYSESILTVNPGETLYYFTGQGSTTTGAAGDSWISRASNGSNPLLLAKGGQSVANNDGEGAQGGRANQGVGTIRINGGNGSNAGGDGGDGGDSPNGGTGGDGASSNNGDGTAGNAPGGGGGGAKTQGNGTNRDGGNGGNGQITFSYSCDESVDPPAGDCWRYIDDGSVSGVIIIEFFEDCTWAAPEGLLEFEVLAIGGGGGGGVRSGGGGGGGGAVHARALVGDRFEDCLEKEGSFPIIVGDGGEGSTDQEQKGGDGSESRFDFGGDYQIQAGGGGGGGSDDDDADNGNPGNTSSYNTATPGFSIVSSILFSGSGGGGGHDGNGGNGYGNSGDGNDHSGGGGGGLSSNDGSDAPNNDDGGNGANGRQFSLFDITLNRFFGAGGGGGSRDDEIGFGGSNSSGGDGGIENDNDATNGGNATTPGSGGGGSGHDDEVRGGNGAKGVVFVRYEISRILPVEYIFIKAEYLQDERLAELSWSTAKEWENSHFEVERSFQNINDWEMVGKLEGMGHSDVPIYYNFQDKNLPLTGGTVYYRLKQVDFAENVDYSKVLSVRIPALQFTPGVWRAYPNPTDGEQLRINLIDRNQYDDEPIIFRIIHPMIQTPDKIVRNESEMNEILGEVAKRVSRGVFVVEIKWGNRVQHIKILKQ